MAPCSKASTAYWSKAVTKTTCARFPMARAASRPFTPGMWMSRKNRRGACAAITCSTSRPSAISWTMASSGQSLASLDLSCARRSGSSSAMTALTAWAVDMRGSCRHRGRGRNRLLRLGRRARVDLDGGDDPARRVLLDDEPRAGAVERLEPLADVGEPHARALARRDALARVRHREAQLAALLGGPDRDRPRLAAGVDAV